MVPSEGRLYKAVYPQLPGVPFRGPPVFRPREGVKINEKLFSAVPFWRAKKGHGPLIPNG